MNLSMRKIYLMAIGLMIIVFCANTWNLIVSWGKMNLPGKISFIFGSCLFNLLFVAMFVFLYKVTPDMTVDNSKLDDVLKEYENKNK